MWLKKATQLSITCLVVGLVFAAFASNASAAWTVLGGDPLFPGGIPNANQEGRNKFVHDMLSPKGITAQKRAGLNAKERQAFKQALVHGEFKPCTLHFGDHFEAMSFGAGEVFVDRNVTYEDPDDRSAPAFCLNVVVDKGSTVIRIKVPFRCENVSIVTKKHVTPPKKHPPKKCKCKKKPKPKPKKSCEAKGLVTGPAGSCVQQTNTANAQQECEAKVSGQMGSQCNITIQQINANCSDVAVGNTAPVNQGGGNCQTGGEQKCVGQQNCVVTPPPPSCPCKPEEPEKPKVKPEVVPDKTQEFEVNETTKEQPICATARIGAGATITAVYVDSEYGSFPDKNHKATQKSAERFCTESYKAPGVLPPFRCTESGLDATAEWCDIVTWTAEASNGTKTSVTKQVPIIEEHPF